MATGVERSADDVHSAVLGGFSWGATASGAARGGAACRARVPRQEFSGNPYSMWSSFTLRPNKRGFEENEAMQD